jgi:CDP-diacylglycerol---glycerol-3-phosphate 3-phosphatidyltransferase
MLEPLKPLYNTTLRPVARLCLRMGIHPNHITILGMLFFVAAGILCSRNSWIGALILVITGSLMDGLDGVLAREGGKKSTFGAILDSSCDRLTEMALLGGLLVYYQHSNLLPHYSPLLCYIALCCSVMVSYVKARCEGVGIACSRGLLQRPERLILLCIGLAAGPLIMVWILGIIALLGFFTMIERLVQAAKG